MSLVEDQRYALEEIDQIENAISHRILTEPKGIHGKIAIQHQISHFLDHAKEQAQNVLNIYKDEDKSRENELLRILGNIPDSNSISDPMDEFDKQINEIKAYHEKYPNQPIENLNEFYSQMPWLQEAEDYTNGIFTDEEYFGRFLDLISIHEEWLTLPNTIPISYPNFIEHYDTLLEELPIDLLKSNSYYKYMCHLDSYLESFLKKSIPLEDPEGQIKKIIDDFNNLEKSSNEFNSETNTRHNKSDTPVPSDHIYCEACKKTFKKSIYQSHINGKKHKKNLELNSNNNNNNNNNTNLEFNDTKIKNNNILLLKYKILKISDLLAKKRQDTKINVERKAALTERERILEQEALDLEYNYDPSLLQIDYNSNTSKYQNSNNNDSNDENNNSSIYNPLKLPLNWDGKPIPFWLWKLHGLGVEFTCEICGNYIYNGRKAFEKHFVEMRHVHGLKCLGINDPILFREITSIQEAVDLWKKIQAKQKKENSYKENTVEMEDDEGNVMSEKVYNDLKKQGLL